MNQFYSVRDIVYNKIHYIVFEYLIDVRVE